MRQRQSLLRILMVGAALLLLALPTFAQNLSGVVTANALNVRTEPVAGGSSEVIGTLYRGETVTIVGRTADTSFYDVVTASGLRGWASSAYIYVAVPNSGRLAPVTSGESGVITVAARGIVNTYRLNVRTAPDVRADVIATLAGGTGVDIIGRNSNSTWFEVVLNDGRVGWVASAYLVERNGQGEYADRQNSDQIAGLPAAIGLIRANRLNVRVSPDPLAAIVKVAVGGERVTLLRQNSDSSWYYVQFEDNSEGWVYSEYISFYLGDTSQAETVTVPQSARPSTTYSNGLVNQPRLNIRAMPAPNGVVLDTVGYMSRVDVIGRNANTTWLQVDVNGTVGWVYAPYITPNVGNFANAPITG